MIKLDNPVCAADTKASWKLYSLSLGTIKDSSWGAGIVVCGAVSTTYNVSTINFVVCTYIMNVLNIFVLFACDCGSKVKKDDTLSLRGFCDWNLSMILSPSYLELSDM